MGFKHLPETLRAELLTIHRALFTVKLIKINDKNDSSIHDMLASVNTNEYIWIWNRKGRVFQSLDTFTTIRKMKKM